MKGIEFDQYSSPVLAEPTLRLNVAIATTYHLTIGITYVTNAFQNTLKAYSECEIIDCPPHKIYWFKLLLPFIRIEPSPDGKYVMYI